ncbi:MAG: flippase-like domain-containing protein [Bacillota bacterium]|nr:flippase-like domain-containing protein [Bacillota bacterium]
MTKPLPAWKKGLGISLALSIVTALFVFIYNFDEDTLESLLLVRIEYLLAALLMVFLLWIIEGLRIKLLVSTLSCKESISIFAAMQVFLVTFFFASVTPLAAGEWPAHIYALNRLGLSLGESSAVTLTRSFLTKLVFTITAISMLIFFRGRLVPNFLNQIFLYAVFVSVITVFFLLFVLWKPTVLDWFLCKAVTFSWGKYFFKNTPRGKKIYEFLGYELQEFLKTTRSLNRFKAGNLIAIIILTIAFWICFFSIGPVILIGLNKPVPYLQALIWLTVIQMIIVYIPIPGGSGVAELSLASIFVFFVPSSVVGIFVVAWRFFTYYLLLFFGGIFALGSLK